MTRNILEESRISQGTLTSRNYEIDHRAPDGFHDSLAISRDDVRDGFAEPPIPSTEHREHIRLDAPAFGRTPRAEDELDKEAPPPRMHICSAARLKGDRVRNAAGESLGTIKEIAINLVSGQVAYAVLSFGGVLGIGAKLFTIPWDAVRIDEAEHEFVLDMERQTLEDAPGLDRHNWPSVSDEWCGLAIEARDGLRINPESNAPDGSANARETNRSIHA
jgi:sporulation protein YlmC with PRC-barrel domain